MARGGQVGVLPPILEDCMEGKPSVVFRAWSLTQLEVWEIIVF